MLIINYCVDLVTFLLNCIFVKEPIHGCMHNVFILFFSHNVILLIMKNKTLIGFILVLFLNKRLFIYIYIFANVCLKLNNLPKFALRLLNM